MREGLIMKFEIENYCLMLFMETLSKHKKIINKKISCTEYSSET